MTILNCQQPSVPHILSAVVVIYSSVSRFKVIIKQSCCFGQQVQQKAEKMARSFPMEFKMYFKVDFKTVIREHHVYKSVWSPVMDQVLECKRDACRGTRARFKCNWCLLNIKPKGDACWTCSHRIVTFIEKLY